MKHNKILKDIGSGLKEDRRNFQKMLKMVMNKEVSKVVIAYPDRLTRFGFKILKDFFKSFLIFIGFLASFF